MKRKDPRVAGHSLWRVTVPRNAMATINDSVNRANSAGYADRYQEWGWS